MAAAPRKRSSPFAAPTPPPEKPPRLLSESKHTSAALALLEKGIRFIYQKEFKKARQEFEAIAAHHPGEAEIIKNALQEEGLRCFLEEENQAGLEGLSSIAIKLQVPANEAEQARKFILKHEHHRKHHG